MSNLKQRPVVLIVMAVLAVLQGVLGLLRSFEWFRIGIDLAGRGVIILPVLGVIAMARSGLIALVALLYFLFAWGALARQGWAWWLGLIAALINGFLVVGVLMQGESVMQSLLWAVVPVILVIYLFAPAGRQLRGH
jgi:hypothetical protein